MTTSETIPEVVEEVSVTDSSDIEDVCIPVESDEVVVFSVKNKMTHNWQWLIVYIIDAGARIGYDVWGGLSPGHGERGSASL